MSSPIPCPSQIRSDSAQITISKHKSESVHLLDRYLECYDHRKTRAVGHWVLSIAAVMKYKFKKGSEVEVWNKREVPSGSWCCAEIISGNGHTYYVSYLGGVVERVSRKAIRPRPPLMKGLKNWVPGDTLEVFDKYSWKTAEVVTVLGKGYYLVRLLGFSVAFRVHTSALRFRYSWKDNKWIIRGKSLKKSNRDAGKMLPKEGSFCHQIPQHFMEVQKYSENINFPFGNENDFKEHYQGFSTVGKKRPRMESLPEAVRKMRAVGEERRCRLVAGKIPKLLEKVDAVVSPRKIKRATQCTRFLPLQGTGEGLGGGGKYMHTSINNRRYQYFEEELPVEHNNVERCSSSVGSCSAHNSPYRLIHATIGLTEDLDSDSSSYDTYPSPVSGSELPPLTKEAVAAEIHRVELHAYQTTLAALHASGPISWEQEELISNLRLVLNISTDEHLLEIRRLIAVENNST